MSTPDPWAGSWGLHWEGWYQPVLEYTISGVGGIVSAEAFGEPIVTTASSGARTIRRYRGPQVVPTWTPVPSVHYLHGVGGIASAEAFGRPAVILGARGRRQREMEMFRFENELLAA